MFVNQIKRVPPIAVPIILAVIVVFLPQLGLSLPNQRQVLLIGFLTLLVSGLNLSLGYAGELALGQPAIYATGAYVAGYMGVHGETDIFLQILAAIGAALFVGLLTGIPGLRLGNWSLAMTSFFLVLLIPDIVQIFQNQTGGAIGLAGIMPPTAFGTQLTNYGYYLVCVLSVIVWLAFMRNLVTSRHGIALRVLRQSPVLASSLGISVFRTKVTAYALGAVPAGVAGALFANLDHYIAPTEFDFALAVTILAASILGGATSVYGAIIGAVIMQLGPLESTSFQNDALIFYGLLLIVGGVLLANGLTGIATNAWSRWVLKRGPVSRSVHISPDFQFPPMSGASLEVHSISKSFGGNKALRDVSMTAERGKVTALIGPNGSGKTTLLNMICGFYKTDAGSITIDGHQIDGRRPSEIARQGLARTFQMPMIPAGITVSDVVLSGRYTPERLSIGSAVLRLPKYWRVHRHDRERIDDILEIVGLTDLKDEEAVKLSLGTRRLLEIARALVSEPRVILLDESASGLDEDEVARLALLISRIRDAGGSVILVEHNFRLVLSLADTIHVLAQGEIIASGAPAEIEINPRVLKEYLGVKEKDIEEAAAIIEADTTGQQR
jgi:branched-chain amino acid transport system permease protein